VGHLCYDSEIIIRADGSTKEGLGHLYRGLALSQCIPNNVHFTFVTNYCEIHDINRKKLSAYFIQNNEDDLNIFKKFKSLKLIILDGYNFDSDYQRRIRKAGYKTIYIDDLAEEHMYSDVVINHSPGFSRLDYKGESYVKYFLGPKYSIIRSAFLRKAPQLKSRKGILILMGGSDQLNITYKVLKYLSDNNFSNDSIYAIVGNNYKSIKELYSFKNLNLKILSSLSALELSQLMSRCRFGIMPASTVLYEFLMCGGNALSGYYVHNQKKVYNFFLKNNLIFPLGNFTNNFEETLIEGLNRPKFDNVDLIDMGFDKQSHTRLRSIIENLIR